MFHPKPVFGESTTGSSRCRVPPRAPDGYRSITPTPMIEILEVYRLFRIRSTLKPEEPLKQKGNWKAEPKSKGGACGDTARSSLSDHLVREPTRATTTQSAGHSTRGVLSPTTTPQ